MSTNRQAFDDAIAAWNAGDLGRYLTLYDERIALHGYSAEPMDKATVRGFYGALFDALDDIRLDIVQVVEGDDRLAVQGVMSGVHAQELFGMPATGVRVEQEVMTILRFEGGRCIERWSVADTLGVMTQIGALPAPA